MARIARVAYAHNSVLEDAGEDAFFLDCLVCEDGVTVVDRHSAFKSRAEFMDAIKEIIPVIEESK